MLSIIDFEYGRTKTYKVRITTLNMDILLVNHAPFHELVKKFIVCASSLADKEKSVNQEQSLQALIERYLSKKVRYV